MDRVNQRTNHLLGKNLRKLREKNDLKNKDVVARLQVMDINVNSAILSKVECGTNNPSVDLLIGLTKIYNCDFNAFFAPFEEDE